jgi:hypothetical protein
VKNPNYLLLLCLGFATATHADARQSSVPNVQSCVSIRTGSNGAASYGNGYHGLLFDGYYNNGHMDDIPSGSGVTQYRTFACPANATPVDYETGEQVSFNTTQYKCQVTG